jgi:hypothetical protein
MSARYKLIFIIICPTLIFGWTNWKTLETDKFQVIYKPGYELQGEECLRVLEYYRKDVVNLTGHNLSKTPFVIEDIGMMSNGYTDPIFKNIHLFTYAPEPSSELGFEENWWRSVGIHEYIHMAHLTKTGGIPGLLTAILGTPFQPNIWSPFWLIEGITTFGESQMSPYEGRLNDGFFDAYISACASERKFPSILDATYLPFGYPFFNGRYIYGGKFFEFLAEKYGKERFAYLFENKGSSILSYFDPIFPAMSLDGVTSSSFFSKNLSFLRRDFPFLYGEWEYYETEKSKTWRIDGERLTKKGATLKFLAFSKNKLYYVSEAMVKTGAVRAFGFNDIIERDLNTQSEKKIVSLTTNVTCPLRIINDKLYYSALDMNKGYANTSYLGFGFISNLHEKNLLTGKDKILLRDKFRSFALLKDGSVLYAKDKKQEFGSELYIYSLKSKKREKLLETDFLIGEIDISDTNIVVSARKDWESWNIYLFDIVLKTFSPIIETPYKESSIYLNDSKIFFISNYEKIYTCFVYDLVTKNFFKLTEGGYTNYPVYNGFDSTLYFVGVTSNGNDIYRKRVNFTVNYVPKEYKKIEQPELLELSKEVKKGGYLNSLKTLFPTIHIPLILPADTTLRNWTLGGYLIGSDALGEHNYEAIFLFPTYSGGKPSFSGIYTSYFFSPLVTTIELDNYSPYFSTNISYPFFNKLDAHFSYLDVSLSWTAFDTTFSRKTLFPNINSVFTFPKTNISSSLAYLIERRSLGSSVNRNGFFLLTNIRQYIFNSELLISVKGLFDPDNPDSTGPLTSDPFNPFYVKTGASVSFDYSFPLFKIRSGLWNPNFYIEDICPSFFCEFAYSYDKKEYKIFAGGEIKLETSFLFGDYLRIIPKIGAGVDEERNVKVYFGIESGSWLTGGFSPKQEIRDFIIRKKKEFFQNWKSWFLEFLSFKHRK